MRKSVVLGILSLFFLSPLALITACMQQAEPAPAPAPMPSPAPVIVDKPKLSENEVCALIWNKIPSQIANGYSKNDLSKDSRIAKYESDGKWAFTVSGEVKQEGPITTEILKTKDYWMERKSYEITSYELKLKATYYENTSTIDIGNIEKSHEKVTTKTSDIPILRKEIKLKWMNVVGTAHHYWIEGSIENIGKTPIARLLIEFSFFTEDRNLKSTEQYEITPDLIPSGERGKFKHDFIVTGKKISSYDYRFVLETGEQFTYIEGWEEEPIFHCKIDREETTTSVEIPSGLYIDYVMPSNKYVRDAALSIINDAPEGVFSNAESWKIWKIHDWVIKNIDYVSDPLGLDYVAYPHETLDCKAGDCDDYAVLLASMYESSGLDAMIAFVDTSGDSEVEHVACLVYYSQSITSFLEQEEIIINNLDVSYPLGKRHLEYILSTDTIIPDKTSDVYDDYEEGIWIVADPPFAQETGIVGYILHQPYVILAVSDVGS